MSLMRTRWAAIGAAVAVTVGAGGIGLVSAASQSGGTSLVAIAPCRLIDTRPGVDNVGPRATPLVGGATLTVSAHGANGDCTGIPSNATALSLNITALGATRPTYLTVWASGTTRPDTSSLNPTPGEAPTPNAVTAQLSATGQFDIFNLDGAVDVIVDVNGYHVDASDELRYGIGPDDRIVLSPGVFSQASDVIEANGGQQWSRTPLLSKLDGSMQCVAAGVDLPAGRTVTAVHLTYASAAGTTVEGSVDGTRIAAGDDDVLDEHDLTTANFPATPAATYADGVMEVADAGPALTGYVHTLTLCADDAITISAVSVQLDS